MSITLIPEDVTNSSPDDQLNKAFADIVDQYEKHGEATLPTTTNDTDSKDSFDENKVEATEPSSEVTPNQSQSDALNTSSQPDGQQIPENNTSDDISVQQLKEELRKKEMDIQLQHSRLNELSARYQELKALTELNNIRNTDSGATLDSSKATKSSEAVKEFFETFPDMAEAVSQMIEEKTSAATKSFEETLNNRVIPIQQHLEQNATQAFINKVLAVHPDALQIANSPALRAWSETLDPVMQYGVKTVMQYGNADDVIALLTQFKNATSTPASSSLNGNGSTTQGGSMTPKPSFNNSLAAREDEIAKKVLSMLNLPSNTQEPAIIQNKPASSFRNVDEAFAALCAEQEGKSK